MKEVRSEGIAKVKRRDSGGIRIKKWGESEARPANVPHPAAHSLCAHTTNVQKQRIVCRKDAAPPTAIVSFNFQ